MNKPGRNDPCPCGSGKKFKQCCMSGNRPSASVSRNQPDWSVAQALQAGLELHQAGRLADAERHYRRVLELEPANPNALHFLGVLAHQIKRHAQGAELIEQSIRQDHSNPAAHNNLGDAYLALGRFEDALASFRTALALKPDFHEVRNNLGETLRVMGRIDEAAACFREVLSQKPDYAIAYNNLGLALQGGGDIDAAIECFRKTLALAPGYINAYNNLGESLRNLGRADEALENYQKALVLNPDFAEAWNNLGLVLRQQGRLDEALATFEKALALRPDLAEIHNNLGILHLEQGRAREAIAGFERAVALKPAYVEAHCNLLRSYKESGQTRQALIGCQAALKALPGENSLWALFSDITRLLPSDAADLVDAATLLAALRKDEIDAQKIEHIAVAFLHYTFPALEACETASLPMDWQVFKSSPELQFLIESPLLIAILEETILTDYRLEKLLTRIRGILLGAAVESEATIFSQALERFAVALAQQCFANEYIFSTSAEETQLLSALMTRIDAAMRSDSRVPDGWIFVAGAYQALHQMSWADMIKPEEWQTEWARRLITRQLIEPLREAALKKEIPRLTAVENQVSVAVQQQYEASPYPRWRKCGRSGNGKSINAFLRDLFPRQEILQKRLSRPAPACLEVLIAGCGTGYHAIQAARRFDSAAVLAVDLSLSSLAFARRSTEENGIANIDYRQADILQLATLGRQFDVIESCGVLHHMADPLQGWQVLVDLLRPGGAMFIGLYSERARRQVSALRRLIVERGYPATREGIRRFRADALSGKHDIPIGDLAISPDFNSTSACRDLLFHVQEHLFTPLKIQSCLDRLGLQFLGFEIPYPEVKRNFLIRFPDNPACDSLQHWDLFEQDHPHVFSGMYQFWVQKAIA